jgi:peptidoglycan/LPS O-acetylase OafA/YrhL
MYLIKKDNALSKILRSFGDYSFGIYLTHPFVLYILVIIFLRIIGMSSNDWFFYFILLIATLLISLGVTHIISYILYSKFLIGIPTKYKKIVKTGLRVVITSLRLCKLCRDLCGMT